MFDLWYDMYKALYVQGRYKLFDADQLNKGQTKF